MRVARPKSKQNNRFALGLIVLCACMAIVLNMVVIEHRQKHTPVSGSSGARASLHRGSDGTGRTQLARLERDLGEIFGLGGAVGETPAGSDGGGSGTPGFGDGSSGFGGDGPSEDRDGSGAGFLPNGEDGLMILADFVIAAGDSPQVGGIIDAITGVGGPGAGTVPGEPGEPGEPGASWPQGGGGPPAGSPGATGPFGGGLFGGGGPGGPAPGAGGPTGNSDTTPDGDGPTCFRSTSSACVSPKPGSGSLPASPTDGPTDGSPPTFGGPLPPTGGPGGAPVVGSPAPEPSTWLLLIAGFGGLGQAMRLRRTLRSV